MAIQNICYKITTPLLLKKTITDIPNARINSLTTFLVNGIMSIK